MTKRLSGAIAIAIMASMGSAPSYSGSSNYDPECRREPWKGKGKRKKARMR